MLTALANTGRKLGRACLLLLTVTYGTICLARFAPGYLSDVRELDTHYAGAAETQLRLEATRSQSTFAMLGEELRTWRHGSLGESRQFHVPVTELIGDRLAVSGGLLLRALVAGWLLACCCALPISAMRQGAALVTMPFTLLLAIPTGALATACIVAGHGGPVLVLSLLVASRDFQFARRLFRTSWQSQHSLYARAGGIRLRDLLRFHIGAALTPQLAAVALLSLLTALSALVPVEVVFNLPGVGQLAWGAVMNRDLPVLMAVMLLMSVLVTTAGLLARQSVPLGEL